MPHKQAHGATRSFPYFPFFVDDWLTSDAIDGFTVEQEGVYLRLLMRQWKSSDGKLQADEVALAKYTRLGTRWAEVGRPVLKRCFVKRGNGYVNLRLWSEWLQVRQRSAQAKASAEKRWKRNGNGDE